MELGIRFRSVPLVYERNGTGNLFRIMERDTTLKISPILSNNTIPLIRSTTIFLLNPLTPPFQPNIVRNLSPPLPLPVQSNNRNKKNNSTTIRKHVTKNQIKVNHLQSKQQTCRLLLYSLI